MIILFVFAFLAGVVTILSPCILPILPIVLSGSIGGGKRRPIGVVTGFILSFTFFTLALSSIVRAVGLSPDVLRGVAVVVVAAFGLSMVIPKTQELLEKLFSRLSGMMPKGNTGSGFWSGAAIGVSLGIVWTPCVGPILASVITLAATSTVTFSAVLITLAYSVGTAIPMLGIVVSGRKLLEKLPFLMQRGAVIQRGFGILMILTALAIAFGVDRRFQAYILEVFPNYGTGLTQFENRDEVIQQLDDMGNSEQEKRKPSMLQNLLTPDYGEAPDFTGGTNWLNSDPLTMESLRGKVVLVDFWTYTCINCIRTFPYLTGWYEKYKDQGFVIVGVHSPEFEFEKRTENVQNALEQYGIAYPVVQDNNFVIWRAYNNRYWPAHYFVDKNGHIRRKHFGEGEYEESEKFIQQLLTEVSDSVPSETLNLPTTENYARTPESYLGYLRLDRFVSPEKVLTDAAQTYTSPAHMQRNEIAFDGVWTIGEEYAMPAADSALNLVFEAKEVFLVLRPTNPEVAGTIRISLDNQVLTEANAGEDVGADGTITIDTDRLYRLLKLQEPGVHLLKIEFLDGNVEAYAFTFG